MKTRLDGHVAKGWGSEFIFATNDKYCGKLLHFKNAKSLCCDAIHLSSPQNLIGSFLRIQPFYEGALECHEIDGLVNCLVEGQVRPATKVLLHHLPAVVPQQRHLYALHYLPHLFFLVNVVCVFVIIRKHRPHEVSNISVHRAVECSGLYPSHLFGFGLFEVRPPDVHHALIVSRRVVAHDGVNSSTGRVSGHGGLDNARH